MRTLFPPFKHRITAVVLISCISLIALIGLSPQQTHGSSCTTNPSILSSSVKAGIASNQDAYEDISNQTGVPWALLAAIHYRETNFGRTNPSNGQGIFQFVNGDGGPYPYGEVSETEFRRQLKFMAERLQTDYVYRGSLNYSKRPLKPEGEDAFRIKDTLFSYNGRSSQYANQAAEYGYSSTTQPYEGSPYVMNRYDCERKNMGIITIDFGSIDGIDTRYGAYTIYSQLVGENGRQTQQILTRSDFNYEKILSDFEFRNATAMDADEIQDFLESYVYSCEDATTGSRADYATSQGSPLPFRCLFEYKENVVTEANNYGSGSTSTYNANQSGMKLASKIVRDAALEYTINPQILLAFMKSTQTYSIIDDDWPLLGQFSEAIAFADCAISESCTSLKDNLYEAAEKLENLFLSNPYGAPATVDIPYHSGCTGTREVSISNRATGALYDLFDYAPNNTALDNMYGEGSACSNYEIRDFWRYYNEWFLDREKGIQVVRNLQFSPSTPKAGGTTSVSFILKNNGATKKSVSRIVVAVRNKANENLNYPTAYNITLEPGQTYTYYASKVFYDLDELTFRIAAYRSDNGWMYTWPHSKDSSIRRTRTTSIKEANVVVSRSLYHSPTTAFVGDQKAVSFIIKNKESIRINAGKFTVAVRDESNNNLNFQSERDIILDPGESYEYFQRQDFNEGGTYDISIANYRSDRGWSYAWPSQNSNSITKAHSFKVNEPNVKHARSVYISPAASSPGETKAASFIIKNNESFPVTIDRLVVAVRDSSGQNYNFPSVNNIYLLPGQKYQYYERRSFPAGSYRTWVASKITPDSDWASDWPKSASVHYNLERTFIVK